MEKDLINNQNAFRKPVKKSRIQMEFRIENLILNFVKMKPKIREKIRVSQKKIHLLGVKTVIFSGEKA